jgi:hypothetical protein
MDLARWGLGHDKLANKIISYGGRFGYNDAGETANTQVCIFDYGDQALVFEVRGLNTDSYKGAKIGVIYEGTEGYVVMASYSGGAAFDLDGKKVKEFTGGGNHFENFLSAVRSRKHEDLNADIEQGHLSSALCHLGNISYLLGESVAAPDVASKLAGVKTSENVKATIERTIEHLGKNDIDTGKLAVTVGPELAFDPETETFKGNSKADALLTRDYRKPFIVPSENEV